MLHADTREPPDLIGTKHKHPDGYLGLLQKTLGESNVCVRKLDSADFVFYDQDGHSFGIERKSGTDLTSSLNSHSVQANGNLRLLNQITRMKKDYTNYALLIEGVQGHTVDYEGVDRWTIDGKITGWQWLAVMMMLWSWEQGGLKMFYTPDKLMTVELLRGLNNRADKGCVFSGLKGKKK